MSPRLPGVVLAGCVVLTVILGVQGQDVCRFPRHVHGSDGYEKLKPFIGKRYMVQGHVVQHHVTICSDALDSEFGIKEAAVVSVGTHPVSLGRYTNADLVSGYNWVQLEYFGGDEYHNHCNMTSRRTLIMITCDPYITDAEPAAMTLVSAVNTMTEHCYFLFELRHQALCPAPLLQLPVSDPPQPYPSTGIVVVSTLLAVIMVCVLVGGVCVWCMLQKREEKRSPEKRPSWSGNNVRSIFRVGSNPRQGMCRYDKDGLQPIYTERA